MLITMSTAGLSLAAAIASAVGALGAWLAATWSLRSSGRSAQATAALSAIEQDRRRSELTPRFRLTLVEGKNGMDDQGLLDVELIGPVGLDYLDEVVIRILDEKGQIHWASRVPTNVTEEEAAAFVWGPWEFNAYASQQVSSNRMTVPQRYSRIDGTNWDHLDLRRTEPGHWMRGMTKDAWQQQRTQPLRISIVCRRDPYPAWYLLCDVMPGVTETG